MATRSITEIRDTVSKLPARPGKDSLEARQLISALAQQHIEGRGDEEVTIPALRMINHNINGVSMALRSLARAFLFTLGANIFPSAEDSRRA